MNRHTRWSRVILVVAIAALGACGSSSSKKVTPPTPPPPPPPPPPVTYTITAVGGEGLVTYGGNGGYFGIEDYSGGDASVLKSGSVNTDFVLPTNLPYLGVNPWEVTADATLEVGTAGFHFLANDQTVYDDAGNAVTGIRVQPGVTLTLKQNIISGGLGVYTQIGLSDGLIVEGTIKMPALDLTTPGDGASPYTSSFYAYPGGMWIADTGKIDLSGESSPSGAGEGGGSFITEPDFFFNAGVIDTSGGFGTNGGVAGEIAIHTGVGGLINTGSLLANGGAGGTGTGGDGYEVHLVGGDSSQGCMISTGVISATGGDGDTGGGAGARAFFGGGNLLVAGAVNTYGGNATDAAQDASGGRAGNIDAGSEGEIYGSVRWAGAIDAHGGAGTGAGSGGDGGWLDIYTAYSQVSAGSEGYALNGNAVAFGANVNLNGGAGSYGGNAGSFHVYTSSRDDNEVDGNLVGSGGAPLTLVGYSSIDVSGGAGKTDGGDAGHDNYIEAYADYDESGVYYAGNAVNEVDIIMRGGEGKGGHGGNGYGLTMDTENYAYAPFNYGVTNSGALDGNGGKGTTDGGAGGDSYMHGFAFVNNTGAVTSSGGEAGTGTGGSAGEVELYSENNVTSSGALTSNGGASASGAGATGGDVNLQAAELCTVSGSITASGGTSTSATGGDGGNIWILSQGTPTAFSAALTAAAGGGGTTPVAGEIWLDGMQISGP